MEFNKKHPFVKVLKDYVCYNDNDDETSDTSLSNRGRVWSKNNEGMYRGMKNK